MVLTRIKYPPQRETTHYLLKLGMLSTQMTWKCDHFGKQLVIFLKAFKQYTVCCYIYF